jgi:hypothetical protein
MRKILAVPFALAAASVAVAQMAAVPTREQVGFAAIREGDLRTDLAYLTSDALGGRMSLQPGDDAAIKWVAGQFAKAGLTPAAKDAQGKPSFLQAMPLVEYRPDRKALAVTVVQGGKTLAWTSGQVAGGYKNDVDLTAPVVFAGFGITAPELGYDDYKGIDAKGKIVLIFDHEPQENDAHSIFNGTGNTRYATSRVKVLNAQAHGAVAVLIVAEPNRKHLTNAERSARIGGSVTRTTPLPLQAIENDEIHIPSLLLTQDAPAAALMATSGTTPAEAQTGIDRDLKPQSRVLPETAVTLHLRNASRTVGTTYNVVGLLPGSDPKLAVETVLISGHHDHDGESPTASGGMDIWHGADDNGSGTVGVVELAQAFAANLAAGGAKPKRSILFVVFASEERGLLGSYWMAAHPLRPLATTRAMINFDMIGRNEAASPQTEGLIEIPADTTNRLNLIGALYSPDYDRVVHEENKAVGLTLDDRFDHESALNVFFRSDQFPFVLHNIPAFWFFTGFHPDYHHVTDTAEKINYAKMTKILQLSYLTAWRFGDDAKTPRFIENPAGAAAGDAHAK